MGDEADRICEDGMLFELDNDAEERAEQARDATAAALLGRIDAVIESVSDDMTVAKTRAALEALGVDVDRMIASVERKLGADAYTGDDPAERARERTYDEIVAFLDLRAVGLDWSRQRHSSVRAAECRAVAEAIAAMRDARLAAEAERLAPQRAEAEG